jgi:hypothetical protein
MEALSGWLLVYFVGTVPLYVFFAAGLSGWYYDYPLPLFAAILAVLLVPLVILLMKLPSAPIWNIAGLWLGGGLITARIIWGVAFANKDALTTTPILIMSSIATVAIVWASVWTWYFLVSERVANTFQ